MDSEAFVESLLEIPDCLIADFLKSKCFNDSEINIHYGKAIISVKKDIRVLNETIGQLSKNSLDPQFSELDKSKISILSSKLLEKKALLEIICLKGMLIKEKITNEDYIEKRDKLLNDIVLIRSKLYHDKEWIKSWCAKNDMSFDVEWFQQFGVYMIGNRRDFSTFDVLDKLVESREILALVKAKHNKGRLLDKYSEVQKEVAVVGLIVPGYINDKKIKYSNEIHNLLQENKRGRRY